MMMNKDARLMNIDESGSQERHSLVVQESKETAQPEEQSSDSE